MPNNEGYYLKAIIKLVDKTTIEFTGHLDKKCGYLSLGFNENMDDQDMWVFERDETIRDPKKNGVVRDLFSTGKTTPKNDA